MDVNDEKEIQEYKVDQLRFKRKHRNNRVEVSDEELKELDFIANLMLKPNENFDKLKKIWSENNKFKVKNRERDFR